MNARFLMLAKNGQSNNIWELYSRNFNNDLRRAFNYWIQFMHQLVNKTLCNEFKRWVIIILNFQNKMYTVILRCSTFLVCKFSFNAQREFFNYLQWFSCQVFSTETFHTFIIHAHYIVMLIKSIKAINYLTVSPYFLQLTRFTCFYIAPIYSRTLIENKLEMEFLERFCLCGFIV